MPLGQIYVVVLVSNLKNQVDQEPKKAHLSHEHYKYFNKKFVFQ